MILFISGAIMMGYLIGGLFFFRFWKKVEDRFFLFLGMAFWILALEQWVIQSFHLSETHAPLVYCFRLGAFLLILVGLWDKNRSHRS